MSKPVQFSDPSSTPSANLQITASVAKESSADRSNQLFNHHISRENRYDPIQKRKNACQFEECKKIVPVAMRDIKCRCDKVFCQSHRHFSDHHCTFDWHSYGIERLRAAHSSNSKGFVYSGRPGNDHAY
ncbi:MAG: AN1-type zinc finger protein [Parachlamydiales bacterium]